MASVLGKLLALEPAVGPVVQLLTRVAQRDLSESVEIGGWSTKMKCSADALASLQTLLQEIDFFNGQGIKSEETALSLQSVIGPAKTKKSV